LKYRKYELLFTSLGLAVVLGSTIIAINQQADPTEILGQALLAPVLVLALHYGRRIGFISAMVAAIIFIVNKFYLQGYSTEPTTINLIIRSASYGLVGIIGGYIASRMKYLLLKFEDNKFIDKRSNIYNKEYILKLIRLCRSKQARNHQDFTVALIKIEHCKFNLFALNLKNKIIKETAKAMCANIRLVDELGHMGNGVYCLLMPETNLSNANIALSRISKLTIKQLNIFIPLKDRRFKLNISLLGYPKDSAAIDNLLSSQEMPEIVEDCQVKQDEIMR